MKSHKELLLGSFALLFFFFGNAMAQTCYDQNYGYYDCDQGYYYYPDPTQAFVEGAFIGVVLGGFNNSDNYERNHWNGQHNNANQRNNNNANQHNNGNQRNNNNGGQRNWGGQHNNAGQQNNNGGHHH